MLPPSVSQVPSKLSEIYAAKQPKKIVAAKQPKQIVHRPKSTQKCINPAALNPEELECNCYEEFVVAGGCDKGPQTSVQAKCIQCEICKAADTWTKRPLCPAWEQAVCNNAHLENCNYTALLENGNV